MSVTIAESGLFFGEYEETDVFHCEQSAIYKSLGENIKSVEFVLWRKNDSIYFIEAKSSSPRPNSHVDFDGFIDEIYSKFSHSIDLFFSIVINRLHDNTAEMPVRFKMMEYDAVKIKLVLVINGHKTEWLPPISDELKRRLRRQIRTWRLELAVLNHEQAEEYGLLKNEGGSAS